MGGNGRGAVLARGVATTAGATSSSPSLVRRRRRRGVGSRGGLPMPGGGGGSRGSACVQPRPPVSESTLAASLPRTRSGMVIVVVYDGGVVGVMRLRRGEGDVLMAFFALRRGGGCLEREEERRRGGGGGIGPPFILFNRSSLLECKHSTYLANVTCFFSRGVCEELMEGV